MLKVKYIGPKAEKRVAFPMPLMAKGEQEAEIQFAKGETKEIDDRWAEQLRVHAVGTFEVADSPAPAKPPAK